MRSCVLANLNVYRTHCDNVNLSLDSLTVEISLKAVWFQKQIQQRLKQDVFIISLVSVTYSGAVTEGLLIQLLK